MNNHIDDTRYLQWEDGMYVMLEELADPLDEQGYVLALVEDSLRRSVYEVEKYNFNIVGREDCIGIYTESVGFWWSLALKTKLTREQALSIATGETTCTTS
jgi:hypothetical protein